MNTQNIFFSLIRIAMGEELEKIRDSKALVGALNSSENIAKVCALAEHHDMVHLVSAALNKLGISPDSPRLAEAITKEEFKAIFRVDRLNAELKALCTLLEENKIPHIPLKGSVIRSLYPEPQYRVSSDVDILVKEEDCEKAVELITDKLEYTLGQKSIRDVSFFTPSGVHVELHFRLYDEEYLPNLTKLAWESAEKAPDAEYTHYLAPDMFAFYHVAHAAKHLKHGGCGIRAILDVFVMSKHKEFTFDKSNRFLEQKGLVTLAEVFCTLAKVWFEDGCHTELSEALEEYLVSGGVYGSVSNSATIENTKHRFRLTPVLSKIFLSSEAMKKRYPSLKKRPWLLPIYHVYRFFKLVFGHGFKILFKEVKTYSSISKTKIKDTANLMSSLGIDK